MGREATNAGGGAFRARMEHYLYSGEKKHVLAGIAIFAAVFGVPWYFMTRGYVECFGTEQIRLYRLILMSLVNFAALIVWSYLLQP